MVNYNFDLYHFNIYTREINFKIKQRRNWRKNLAIWIWKIYLLASSNFMQYWNNYRTNFYISLDRSSYCIEEPENNFIKGYIFRKTTQLLHDIPNIFVFYHKHTSLNLLYIWKNKNIGQ